MGSDFLLFLPPLRPPFDGIVNFQFWYCVTWFVLGVVSCAHTGVATHPVDAAKAPTTNQTNPNHLSVVGWSMKPRPDLRGSYSTANYRLDRQIAPGQSNLSWSQDICPYSQSCAVLTSWPTCSDRGVAGQTRNPMT